MDFKKRVYEHFARKDVTLVLNDPYCVAPNCHHEKFTNDCDEFITCETHRDCVSNIRMPEHTIGLATIGIKWQMKYRDDGWYDDTLVSLRDPINRYSGENRKRLVEEIIKGTCDLRADAYVNAEINAMYAAITAITVLLPLARRFVR